MVWRLKDQAGPDSFDGRSDGRRLVGPQVIHDDYVPGSQRWHQSVVDESLEGLVGRPTFVGHQAAHAIRRDGASNGKLEAVAFEWYAARCPNSAPRPRMGPRQGDVGAR